MHVHHEAKNLVRRNVAICAWSSAESTSPQMACDIITMPLPVSIRNKAATSMQSIVRHLGKHNCMMRYQRVKMGCFGTCHKCFDALQTRLHDWIDFGVWIKCRCLDWVEPQNPTRPLPNWHPGCSGSFGELTCPRLLANFTLKGVPFVRVLRGFMPNDGPTNGVPCAWSCCLLFLCFLFNHLYIIWPAHPYTGWSLI